MQNTLEAPIKLNNSYQKKTDSLLNKKCSEKNDSISKSLLKNNSDFLSRVQKGIHKNLSVEEMNKIRKTKEMQMDDNVKVCTKQYIKNRKKKESLEKFDKHLALSSLLVESGKDSSENSFDGE